MDNDDKIWRQRTGQQEVLDAIQKTHENTNGVGCVIVVGFGVMAIILLLAIKTVSDQVKELKQGLLPNTTETAKP